MRSAEFELKIRFARFQEAVAQLALKNELVVDRLASLDVRAGYDTIRAELMDLESQMKQTQDAVESLKRLQQRLNRLTTKISTDNNVVQKYTYASYVS